MVYNTRSQSMPSSRSLPSSPGPAVAGLFTPSSSHPVLSRLSLGNFTDFGGGSSDRRFSFAPDTSIITTPPRPPIRGADTSSGESCNCICRKTRNLYSFSPKTCLELLRSGLLSDAQLNFELEFLSSLGLNVDIDAQLSDTNPDRARITHALEQEISVHNCHVVENSIRQLNNIKSSVSCTAEHVETLRRRSLPQTPVRATAPATAPVTAQRPVATSPQATPPTPSLQEEVTIDDTVCRLFDSQTINFSEITVPDILSQIKVESPATHGNRKTAYFGDTSYRYGLVKHDPRPYPDCPVFDSIFNKMRPIIPDFTKANYTCLVTLYPNGQSSIKPHSDNEAQICPKSSIYTISVGSIRTAVFQNQLGVINETHVDLTHGSVYAMTRDSQSDWKHSILPDPNIQDPRISFTFRKLITEADIPKRAKAPPIVHPDDYQSPESPPRGSHQGILLLTDSILAGTPEFIFDKIDGFRCIKKINKRLTDIFNFEPEFRYRKTVVISAGVNDLSCHGLRAHVLADMICNRLEKTCRKYPKTTFLYNSILYTGHSWLNEEIKAFNEIMFDLSLKVTNLFFFDSSAVIESSPLSRRWADVIQRTDPRCVHITLAARRLISDELVKGADLVCRGRNKGRLENWSWPLRSDFAAQLAGRDLT